HHLWRTPMKALSLLSLAAIPSAAFAQPFAISWFSIDAGGTTTVSAGTYTLGGTIGQPDAGLLTSGSLQCLGGFWGAAGAAAVCYANCDGSTTAPVLTANDFQCFLNAFASGQSYANCDGSTINPVLTANDF